MSSFNEGDHPRDHSGRFDHKHRSEADVDLDLYDEGEAETDRFGFELGRGGFPRNHNGAALIVPPDTDPDELPRYKSGKNAGRPRLDPYRSASGIAVATSEEGLTLWKLRRIATAIATHPELAESFAEAIGSVDDFDPDSDEGKKVLKPAMKEAHDIAETDAAARRGTFAHWVTEQIDNGQSPLEAIEEGEALGIDAGTQQRIADGWQAINDDYGFESVAVETKLVNDHLKAAGTTDRVVRLTKPLRYDVGNGPEELPAGSIIIADLKTGKLRTRRDGRPQYWEKYSAQLATYAGGIPYNPTSHTRQAWNHIGVPGKPSQHVGVIIHGDLDRLANPDGNPREAFKVFACDLNKGRQLAEASNALREAERATGSDSFAAV